MNVGFKGIKLKQVLGIRGRLILLALVLVVPLMADRVRVLENMRASQTASVSLQLADIARRGAARKPSAT